MTIALARSISCHSRKMDCSSCIVTGLFFCSVRCHEVLRSRKVSSTRLHVRFLAMPPPCVPTYRERMLAAGIHLLWWMMCIPHMIEFPWSHYRSGYFPIRSHYDPLPHKSSCQRLWSLSQGMGMYIVCIPKVDSWYIANLIILASCYALLPYHALPINLWWIYDYRLLHLEDEIQCHLSQTGTGSLG